MLSIKKVLFPTDFSETADHAMNWALMLAKNFEAHLDMLHTVVLHADDVGEEVFSRFPDIDECIKSLMTNADSRLEKPLRIVARFPLNSMLEGEWPKLMRSLLSLKNRSLT